LPLRYSPEQGIVADGMEGEVMRLNWAAVLVAASVHFLLGAVWFTVFSNPWTAGLRMPQEELAAYKAHPNFWPYVIAFLCNLVLAIGESHTPLRGIRIGILVGLATAVAMVTEMVFEMMGPTFMAISAGYPLAGCIIMGIIIGAWKPKGLIAADGAATEAS
jgi:hypothetical protein